LANGYVSPGGTIPFPSPDSRFRPVGYWEGEVAVVGWLRVVPGESNVTTRGTWRTPVFNLRPDTDTASSRQNRASPINRVSGTQLFVAVIGLISSSHIGLECYARILGHPTDPLKVAAVQPDTNITADLSTGLDTAVLSFLPFSGYPLKYWQVELRFDFTSVVPATFPSITLQPGIY
jgi:hypothetical protein